MKKRPFRSGCTTRSIPLRRASTTPVFILPRGYPSSAPHTASPCLNSACSAPPVHAPREKHVPAPAALPPQNVTILLIRSTTERLPQPPCTFLTERYRTPPSTPSCSALSCPHPLPLPSIRAFLPSLHKKNAASLSAGAVFSEACRSSPYPYCRSPRNKPQKTHHKRKVPAIACHPLNRKADAFPSTALSRFAFSVFYPSMTRGKHEKCEAAPPMERLRINNSGGYRIIWQPWQKSFSFRTRPPCSCATSGRTIPASPGRWTKAYR